MRYVLAAIASALLCACIFSSLDGLVCEGDQCAGANDAGDGGAPDADGGQAADAARCSLANAFGEPVLVTELYDDAGGGEIGARLTGDELTVFFTRIAADGTLRTYGAVRSSPTAPFGVPSEVDVVRGEGTLDAYPSVIGSGLTLYVQEQIDGGANTGLFEAARPNPTSAFSAPQLLTALDTPGYDGQPYVAPDGHSELYFVRGDAGSGGPLSIYVATWSGSQWDNPTPITGSVNASDKNAAPVITADRLTLYFASTRADGATRDIYMAKRGDTYSPFGEATPVDPLNVAGREDAPNWISADECILYMHSGRSGTPRIYRASR